MSKYNEADVSVFENPLEPEIKSNVTISYEATGFGQFTEPSHYLRDENLEYDRNGTEPGLILIFNQLNFPSEVIRTGTLKDVCDIHMCFTRLGYNINPDYIYTDLRKDEIFSNVGNILKTDLSQINSVFVFVLTHGHRSNYLSAIDGIFNADDLIDEFCNCSQLRGKPKVFVFQACKGVTYNSITHSKVSDPFVPTSVFSKLPKRPDVLIAFSTLEDYTAFRHIEKGSWFIQELCRNFSNYGWRDDILTLLLRVTKCVCKNHFAVDNDKVYKQMPVYASTLKKKFYLNRNKNRDLLLRVIDQNENILKRLQNLEMGLKKSIED